ncbi:ATP-binding cassette domain-containing protein [Heliobacterium gestii]|uniref:ATP-binding cassette domain-containing protein n=1 Tax=Heliomicrobium gestii TaxID=2699 RepID=A0A845LCH7_HELGE|nr:ABC transporter ATP-binding protein [Heliomicrobium gestii]MBM7868110.1 iron complex transport system ATP-binding protein [Heliomicrobium gestii]MZP44362.1 ATP-binding cassette domain-containing protein [Heliomicrobium gestii]
MEQTKAKAKAPLLRVKEMAFAYRGGASLMEKIDLSIDRGRFYGILGPNGAGKSTLMNLLTGALSPSRGEILYRSKSVGSYAKKELARRFAVVPQDYGVDFPFQVLEMVLMGRKPHLRRFQQPSETDMDIVYEAMRVSGTLAFSEKRMTELSGGEKQRVIFARALAQDPEVLFLDEATSNLDVKHKLALLGTVRKLNQEKGLTVIAVMHDFNLAGLYCDDLILLDKGTVFAVGPVSDVLTKENVFTVFGVDVDILTNRDNGKVQVLLKDEGTRQRGTQ